MLYNESILFGQFCYKNYSMMGSTFGCVCTGNEHDRVYAVPCVIAFRLCIAFFADCMPGVHGSIPQLCLPVWAWHLPAMCWPPIRMSHLSQASSEKDNCVPVIYSTFSRIWESIFTQVVSVLQVSHILTVAVAGVMCQSVYDNTLMTLYF